MNRQMHLIYAFRYKKLIKAVLIKFNNENCNTLLTKFATTFVFRWIFVKYVIQELLGLLYNVAASALFITKPMVAESLLCYEKYSYSCMVSERNQLATSRIPWWRITSELKEYCSCVSCHLSCHGRN